MIPAGLLLLLLFATPLSAFELHIEKDPDSKSQHLQILFDKDIQGKFTVDFFRGSKKLKEFSQSFYPVQTAKITLEVPHPTQGNHPDSVQVRQINHRFGLDQSRPLFGAGPGQVREPVAITADSFDHIFVLDQGEDKIVKFSRDLGFLHEFGSFNWDTSQSFEDDFSSIEEAGFDTPRDLLAGPDLTYFISDSRNDRIVEMDSSGNFVREFSPRDGFDEPTVLGITSRRELAVLDSEKERILLFDSFGHSIYQLGGYGRSMDRFSHPTDFLIYNQDEFFVLDSGTQEIKKYSRASQFIKSVKLEKNPLRLALDPLGFLILIYPDRLGFMTPDLKHTPNHFAKPGETKAVTDLCFTTNQHLYILQNNPVRITHWIPRFEVAKKELSFAKEQP